MTDEDRTPSAPGRALQQFVWRFENVQFDETRGELLVDGSPVSVEPRPIRLLIELLRHVDEVVTRQELFDSVWSGRITVDNVLANAVNKLRKALGAQAGARLINAPRVGYRLLGPVQRTAVGSIPAHHPKLASGSAVPGRSDCVLLECLSGSGRTNVWRAEHLRTKHQTVFKFASTEDELRQLKREFTLFRVLQAELGKKPEFPEFLDVNFSEQPFWLESTPGGVALAQWAGDNKSFAAMAADDRVKLFIPIVRAVADAHSVGVLHKDLKPSNILIAAGEVSWKIRLIDFGSGRAMDPDQLSRLGLTSMGLTVTHAVHADISLGTPLYLAPEVVAGQPSTVQSDVFSLGVILYQLLVGDFRRQLSSGWEADIPDPHLRDDLSRATQGRPDLRIQTASDLLQRLTTLDQRRAQVRQHEEEVRARTLFEQAAIRRRHRRPWLIGGVASLIVGLSASLWFQRAAVQAERRALNEAALAQQVMDFFHKDVLEAPDILTANQARPIQMLTVLRKASASAKDRFYFDPLTEAIVRKRLAHTFLRLASLNDANKELKRAEELFAQAVPADHPEALITKFLKVWLLAWIEQTGPALELLRSTEAIAGEMRLREHTELSYFASRARVEALFHGRQFEAAYPAGRQLVAIADTLYPAGHHLRLDARVKLMELYLSGGLTEEANRLDAEVSAAPYNAKDSKGEIEARQKAFTGEALFKRGDFEAAEREFVAGRAITLSSERPNEFFLAWFELHLARLHLARADPVRALAALAKSKQMFALTVGPEHVYIKLVELGESEAFLQQGKLLLARQRLVDLRDWHREHNAAGQNAQVEWLYTRLLNLEGQHRAALDQLDQLSVQKFMVGGFSKESATFRLGVERAVALNGLGNAMGAKQTLANLVAEDYSPHCWPWEADRANRLKQVLGIR